MDTQSLPLVPFGKYKGDKISTCTHLSYLIWLTEKEDLNDRFKTALSKRIKELTKKDDV